MKLTLAILPFLWVKKQSDIDVAQKRKVHRMIRKVAAENWHIILGHVAIPLMLLVLDTYLKTIEMHWNVMWNKKIQFPDEEYKWVTYKVLTEIAKYSILHPISDYSLNLLQAKLQSQIQKSDNMLRILSKEDDFYLENNQQAIIGAIEGIPINMAGYIFGILKQTSLAAELTIQYTMRLFPNQYFRLFGINQNRESEKFEGLFARLAMVGISFGIRYLIRKLQKDDEHDENFYDNLSDVLGNIKLAQTSGMHAKEAKKTQDCLIKKYYQKPKDHIKSALTDSLFILPIIMHTVFRMHKQATWMLCYNELGEAWKEMQALSKFDQVFDEIPRFKNKINTLVRQTKLLDESVTQIDRPDAKRAWFKKGEVDITLEDFRYRSKNADKIIV